MFSYSIPAVYTLHDLFYDLIGQWPYNNWEKRSSYLARITKTALISPDFLICWRNFKRRTRNKMVRLVVCICDSAAVTNQRSSLQMLRSWLQLALPSRHSRKAYPENIILSDSDPSKAIFSRITLYFYKEDIFQNFYYMDFKESIIK